MTPRKILLIILAIVAGFTILALSSCSNKWYAKQCVKRFPITESVHDTVTTIVGKVDTFMQLVQFDCDSAIKYSHDTVHLTHSFKVPCPPSIHRVDTFRDVRTIVRKDSAGSYLIQSELADLRQTKIEQREKIYKQSKRILHLYFLFGLIVLAFGIGLTLKFKKL